MIDVSLSIDLSLIAARAAILAVQGLIVLAGAGAGADALDRTFDEAFRDEPALCTPSPHVPDRPCWLVCGVALDIQPADTGMSARSAR